MDLYAKWGTDFVIEFDGNGGVYKGAKSDLASDKVNHKAYGDGTYDVDLYVGIGVVASTYANYADTNLDTIAAGYENTDSKGNELYFVGWKAGGEWIESVSDITEDMVSGGSVTLVAQWSRVKLDEIGLTWTVDKAVEGYVKSDTTGSLAAATLDAAEGNSSYTTLEDVVSESPATAITAVNSEGYAFWGWNTKPDGTGYALKSGDGIDLDDAYAIATAGKDIVLYAQWKPAYTISLDDNIEDGGYKSGNTSVTVDSGKVYFVGEPKALPTWYKSYDSTTGVYSFNADPFLTTFKYGTSSTKKLAGWALTPTGAVVLADGAKTDDVIDALRSEKKDYVVTLYARWDDKFTYTVRFYPNYAGADDVVDVTLTEGGTADIDMGQSFKRTGYKLACWNTERDGSGTTVALSTKQNAALDALGEAAVKGEVQLFAQWTEAVDVTLKGNGAVGADVAVQLTAGDSLPTCPFVINGKVFGGWALDAEGATKVTSVAQLIEAAEDGAITIYATWVDSEEGKATGWVDLGDGSAKGAMWVYYKADGTRKMGWHEDGGKWYYLNPSNDGIMATGWAFVDGFWYYLNPKSTGTKGAMLTGWQFDGSNWYYLSESAYPKGHMLRSQWVGDYYVGQSGAWIQ